MFDEDGEWDGIMLDEWTTYLDDLRESGRTNMFGAGAFLVADYGFTPRDARKILKCYMENVSE